MRLNVDRAIDKNKSSLKPTGGTVTDRIMINSPVTAANHAATKEYLDTKRAGMRLSDFTGTIDINRLPVMSGDFKTSPGSNIISINNEIVGGPDIYFKLNVNKKGLAISGSKQLMPGDIPQFPFSSMSNRPTTVAGWGLLDLIKDTSGAAGGIPFTGSLKITGDITAVNHLVTKKYIDDAFLQIKAINRNEMFQFVQTSEPVPPAPVGDYLRCNGSLVPAASYPALTATMGEYLSGPNVGPSGGAPWKYTEETSAEPNTHISFTSWSEHASTFPLSICKTVEFVTKGAVYIIGGCVGTEMAPIDSNHIYRASLSGDTLGPFVKVGDFPIAFRGGRALTMGGYVYIFTGRSTIDGNTGKVYRSPIAADGSIGTFTEQTKLPYGWCDSALAVGGNVFVVASDYYESSIYKATVRNTGISSWEKCFTLLPRHFTRSKEPELLRISTYLVCLSGYYDIKDGNYYSEYNMAPVDTDSNVGNFAPRGPLRDWNWYRTYDRYSKKGILHTITGKPTTMSSAWPLSSIGGYDLHTGSAQAYVGLMPSDPNMTTYYRVYDSYPSSGSIPVALGYTSAVITAGRIFIIGGRLASGSNTNKIYWNTITNGPAGSDDYSSIYNASLTNGTGYIKLPDMTALERAGVYTYIRHKYTS